jgi:hypothetical protein
VSRIVFALENPSVLTIVLLLTNPVFHDTVTIVSDLQMDVGAFHVGHPVLRSYDHNNCGASNRWGFITFDFVAWKYTLVILRVQVF